MTWRCREWISRLRQAVVCRVEHRGLKLHGGEGDDRARSECIDASFKKLRSAEDAFALLRSFAAIESEGAIGKTMADKFNDILEQFEIVERARVDLHHHPPVNKNQPRSRARSPGPGRLLARAKDDDAAADGRRERCGRNAPAVSWPANAGPRQGGDEVEKRLYGEWVKSADAVAVVHLKRSILRTAKDEDDDGDDDAASGLPARVRRRPGRARIPTRRSS